MSPKKSISDLSGELREVINSSISLRNQVYQQKAKGAWDRLWASMDALDDAQLAIEKFQKASSISYLELYGLLQAFIVQQDSVNHIRQTTLNAPLIKWDKAEPKLNQIRYLRNETVGHPTDIRTGKTIVYCNINRRSVSKTSFEYMIWSQAGAQHKTVDVTDVIKTQDVEVARLIRKIIADIKAHEVRFKKQFSGKKLKTDYSQISHYEFEKLYLYQNNPEIAQIMFGLIKKKYAELRTELAKRYGDFSTTINVGGLKIVIDELDELVKRVGTKLNEGVPDAFDFNVYVENLDSKWKELGEMIDETDEKFS
ncbi:MAG: hypothetical protein WD846_04030 [Patescibacteria group bacterium]